MILHEFLPLTCGDALVADILANGRKFYRLAELARTSRWSSPSPRTGSGTPRCGPATARTSARPPPTARSSSSRSSSTTPPPAPTPPTCAAAAGHRDGSSTGRRSSTSAAARCAGTSASTPSSSSALFHLLGQPSDEPDSLAIRNLVRGLTMEVPSGQRVAAAMQETPLHESELADLEPFGLHKRTPLWFYVLREADVRADGEHLGPVGGRIVAEVFHGLIDGDPSSYLSQDPDWTPTYGTGRRVRHHGPAHGRRRRRRPGLTRATSADPVVRTRESADATGRDTATSALGRLGGPRVRTLRCVRRW